MSENNILKKIKENEYFILVVISSTSFSSKLMLEKINELNIESPFEVVDIKSIKYYADTIKLMAVPAIIIYKNTKIIDILRGVCSKQELIDFLNYQ